ncbi:MAG: hypothetical protein WBC73_15860 [Phormidesmis sp.]
MAKTEKQAIFRRLAQKPLIATALAVAGVFNMMSAVLAEGTPAGTTISNTATATYDDDGDPNTPPLNTTSNTVEIRVAKVAGLTAVASPVNDVDGGAIEFGDQLEYIFEITNVGNAPTDVFIPGTDNLGLENFTPNSTDAIEIFAPDGTSLGTLNAGDAGTTLTDLNGGTTYTIDPDESFTVVVYGTPTPGTVANQPVGVTLGNTTDNAPPEGTDATQNQPTATDDGTTDQNDLRTVDRSGDAPDNGEREAQATAEADYASSVNPLALATILKTSSLATNDSSLSNDDVITYSLTLNVAEESPSPGFQAAALEGTEITLNGGPQTRILVSDAIPTGTEFVSVGAGRPLGWTPVYTTDTSTTDALSLQWVTLQPPADQITRVGFVFDSSLGRGASVTGLNFNVVTNGLADQERAIIENIAQVFGETVGGDPDQIIYDESGDQNPNNFDGNTPPTVPDGEPEGSYYDPTTDTGIPADLADENEDNQPDDLTDVDTGNNNTGTDPDGGEINVVSIGPSTNDNDILNGTVVDGVNTPGAFGPTGNNDDFTNLSTPVGAGLASDDTISPGPVTFNNSLSNPAGPTSQLSNVTIEPLAPTTATFASNPLDPTNRVDYGLDSAIPDGTYVTIVYDEGGPDEQTAVYRYDATGGPGGSGIFNLITNTPIAPGVNPTTNPPTLDPNASPVNVGDLNGGEQVDYTVTVDLPDDVAQLTAVPIPIVAFPDDDPVASAGYQTETTNNITIDRLYTGFMELTKQASIIGTDGTTVLAGPAETLTREVEPGEFIEYLLTYTNISEATGGNGSVLLTATDFTLLEDGDTTDDGGDNNWASTTTHVQATVAQNGTVNYYTTSPDLSDADTSNDSLPDPPSAGTTDPVPGTQVEVYENVVPSVAGGASGTFQFRRMVNVGPTPTP